MRHCHLAVLRALRGCAAAALAVAGLASCTAGAPVACAGQCAPPYELQVHFRAGIPGATAQKILGSCVNHDPVVIRIGTLHDIPEGRSEAYIYTHVFATARTVRLVKCLQSSSGVATVGWPD
jgi:hypothetical protein